MISDQQVDLRKQILGLRKALSPQDRTSLSSMGVSQFLTAFYPFWQKSGKSSLSIGLYRALSSEFSLQALEEEWKADSRFKLYFPRIGSQTSKRSGELEFVDMTGRAEDSSAWEKAELGMMEPASGLISADPSLLDVIFVPGVVFGSSGERIGRGKGHYDRFLARYPQALRVALVFDFQICEGVPQNSWDQKMDWICSEKREWKAPSIESWYDPAGIQRPKASKE